MRFVRARGRGSAVRSLLLGGCLVLAAGCGGGEKASAPADSAVAEANRSGGIATVCTSTAVEGLDPFVSPDQGAVDLGALLFTPLFRYGPEGEIQGVLARSAAWEDGGRRLRLEIRDDVLWHDGRPVTADDVAWTARRASDVAYGYWNAPDFASLVDARAEGPTSVILTFEAPFTAGLEPFVGLTVLPRHLLEGIAAEDFVRHAYHRAPVGSGPYRFDRRQPDGTLRFVRAGRYPAELGPAYLDGVAVRVVPELTTMAAELSSGTVDACVTTAGSAARLRSTRGVEAIPLEPAGVQILALDGTAAPLDDPRVRRAVSAALDRTEIAAVVSPLARASASALPSASPWRRDDLLQPDADPARARAALDSAGWRAAEGGSARRSGAGEPLRLTLTAPPPMEDVLTVMQAQLSRVGFDVSLELLEWATFVGRIQDPDRRPQAMVLGLQPERVLRPDLASFLRSDGPANLSGFSDAGVDELLARADRTTDADSLGAIYEELQRVVAEEVPLVFTIEIPRVLAVGPRVRDVHPGLGSPLAAVASWWIPPAERR